MLYFSWKDELLNVYKEFYVNLDVMLGDGSDNQSQTFEQPK